MSFKDIFGFLDYNCTGRENYVLKLVFPHSVKILLNIIKQIDYQLSLER